MSEFSPYVAEQLQHYVYLLRDPRDGVVFYVGKGVGNRVFAHARDALDEDSATDKLERIRAIRGAGHDVRYELLRFGLSSQTAYEVEAAAIQLLGLDELLNVVAGHHAQLRGRMSTDDAISLFEAPAAPEIVDPVLLIRIPKLWFPGMDPAELLEATAGWWRISARRHKARYAFAVVRGVIREVYEIEEWRQRVEGDRGWEDDAPDRPRWGFSAHIATDLGHFRNRSARHLFRAGEASPIKFVNC